MTSPTTTNDLKTTLTRLRLAHTAEGLDDLVARATKGRWPPLQLLDELARHEMRERERRSLERRLKGSGIGRTKAIADFDWAWPKKINRDIVERALRGDLVSNGENLVLVAAQGLGKTTLAKAIAHATVLAGKSVVFTSAARLVLDLAGRDGASALTRRLRRYTRPALLVIDEVGYLHHEDRAADLLFTVINERHTLERSIIVTTNLAFTDWPTMFPNAACVVAMIDRLIERADIVQIEGSSFRVREAEARRKARSAKSDA